MSISGQTPDTDIRSLEILVANPGGNATESVTATAEEDREIVQAAILTRPDGPPTSDQGYDSFVVYGAADRRAPDDDSRDNSRVLAWQSVISDVSTGSILNNTQFFGPVPRGEGFVWEENEDVTAFVDSDNSAQELTGVAHVWYYLL